MHPPPDSATPSATAEPSPRASRPESLRGLAYGLPLAGAWALLGLVLVDLFFRVSDGSLPSSDFFNADLLYLPALYRDVFEEGGRWFGWRFTPAPYLFPDMPLYFLLDALTGPFPHAVLSYAAAQVVLWVLAAQYLVRAVAPAEARLGQVLAVVVVTALLLLHATGRFWLMKSALLGAFHFSVLLLALVALPLALRTFRRESRTAPWLLGALCLLASASDALFVVAFTVPMAACLGLLAWLQRPRAWRPLGGTLAVMAVASLLGLRLTRWVTGRRSSSGYTRLRAEQVLESLRQLRATLAEQLHGLGGPVVVLWALLVLGLVALLVTQRRRWTAPKSPHWRLYAVGLFTVLMVGANTGAVVLTGNFGDPTAIRYLVVPGLLPLVLLPLTAVAVPPAWRRRAGVGALGALAVACTVTLAGHPWRTRGPLVSDFYPPLVECLDRHQPTHGLAWGVSNYWNAKLVSMFSRTGLRAHQLEDKGLPYHWINNRDWYLARPGPRSNYTFVITDGLDLKTLRQRYGEPRQTLRCEHTEVLVYGEDFDALLRAHLAEQLSPRR